MRTRAQLAAHLLQTARDTLAANIAHLTLDEALQPAGGHRSIFGILKHTAAWSRVYYSYAFEPEPKHWRKTDWPRGLRDTIDPSPAHVDQPLVWLEAPFQQWLSFFLAASDERVDRPLPL